MHGDIRAARYPADIFLILTTGWHNGMSRGELIEKDHGEHMFKLLTGRQYTATGPGSL